MGVYVIGGSAVYINCLGYFYTEIILYVHLVITNKNKKHGKYAKNDNKDD